MEIKKRLIQHFIPRMWQIVTGMGFIREKENPCTLPNLMTIINLRFIKGDGIRRRRSLRMTAGTHLRPRGTQLRDCVQCTVTVEAEGNQRMHYVLGCFLTGNLGHH